MNCDNCTKLIKELNFQLPCKVENCTQTFKLCSFECLREFRPKLESCGRCGLVDFCVHAMPGGSMCTYYDASGLENGICSANICIRCSKESAKLFGRFICCGHEK